MSKHVFQCDIGDTSIADGIATISGIATTDIVNKNGQKIVKGAFENSIKDKQQSGTIYPLLWCHISEEQIGSIDPKSCQYTDKGLEFKANIDLDTQRGKEVYSMISKKMLNTFSIGFSVQDGDYEFTDDYFLVNNGRLDEISLTGIPANEECVITDSNDTDKDSEGSLFGLQLQINRMRAHSLKLKIDNLT